MDSNYLVQSTTFNGARDVLLQYGDEYCIVHMMLKQRLGFWLVEIYDIESTIIYNTRMEELEEVERKIERRLTPALRKRRTAGGWYQVFDRHTPHPFMIIPEDIMNQLLQADVVALSIPDKEWEVQSVLGTAPNYRAYIIQKEAV